MQKAFDVDEVRDTLISQFCDVVCIKGDKSDLECPDHDCIVWPLLTICTLKSAGVGVTISQEIRQLRQTVANPKKK